MATRELELLIKARNEAYSEIDKLKGQIRETDAEIKKMGGSMASGEKATGSWQTSLSSLAKTLGGLYIGKKLLDFGVDAFNSFADAEAQMGKFTATMDTMVGRTLNINTGLKATTTELKYTGAEAEAITRKMEDYKIATKEQEMRLSDLAVQLNKGKITQGEYSLAVTKAKKEISDYAFATDQLSKKLTETDSKETDITRSIHISAKEVADAKQKFIEAGNAVTKFGFDNEEATNMMARFFQATGNVNQSIRMNQIAMDLASAKNIDYAQASKAVQLVLAGNTKVLKEFGIEISDTMTPMQALGELERNVGGQTEALAKTTQGSVKIMKAEWSEMKETVGGVLAEAFKPLIDDVTKWLSDPKNIEYIRQLAVAFGEVLKGAIWLAKEAFNGFKAILDAVMPTFVEIYDYLKGPMGEAFDWVADKVKWLADKIAELIIALEKLDVGGKVKTAWNSTIDYISDRLVPYVSNTTVSGGGGFVNPNKNYSFKDVLISPKGDIITTDPNDFIIATQDPKGLGKGSGGGVVINVYGDVSGQELINKVSEGIMRALRADTKLAI